jgi:phosphatidate cytidylyltransferase
VNDSGDEGGFHPHPGDPWHPEWSDEAPAEEAIADEVAEARVPSEGDEDRPKRRRGLFRRKRKEVFPEETPHVESAADEPSAGGDESAWEDIEAIVYEPPGATTSPKPADSSEAPAARPAEEGPLPAWLSDLPTDELGEPTLVVEQPSWAGEITKGAPGITGGFADAADMGPDELGESETATPEETAQPLASDEPPPILGIDEESPAQPRLFPPDVEAGARSGDLEDVLRALGDLDDEVEVVAVGDTAADTVVEAASSPGFVDVSAEEAAAVSEYGVAPPEAFRALRDLGDEGVDDWQAFAGEQAGSVELGGTEALAEHDDVPRPDAFDEWEEPPRRRGIWPFRRRRRDEAEEVVEEPVEWAGDASQVPEGWFAEIDEDTVVPPAAHLPETEWPEPEPGPSAAIAESRIGVDSATSQPVEPGRWEVPGAAGTADRADEFDSGEPMRTDGLEMEESTGTGSVAAARGEADAFPTEDSAESPPVEFDHGYGFDAVDDLEGSVGTGVVPSPPRSEDDARFRLPEGPGIDKTLRPGSDDAGAPVDDDEWVTGPLEVGPGYDDATLELPAGYASLEDMTEELFTTSQTMEHRGFAEEIVRAGEADTEWQAISAAMPGVGTGVVGFDDVADLGDEEDVYEAPTRSELGTRVITGIVLVGFLIGSVWVGAPAAAGFIGLLVVLGLGEFYGTLRHRGFRPLALFGFLGSVALLVATWFHGPIAIPVAIGLTTVVVYCVYAFAPMRRDALTNGGLTVLGIAWVVGTAAFATPILRAERYRVLILGIVVVTAAMDIGAYSVGRTWGKRALSPVLSPNKSIEGLIGGIITCLAASAAVGYLLDPFDLRSGLALGAVICLVAPIGDLAESMVKRSLGVKDMGAVLPGHGGILDRIDAFLFVIPAAWVLFRAIGLLG